MGGGVLRTIISDRHSKFLSHFRKELQEAFGGQTKRTIQTLGDLLQSCVLEFGTDWESILALA